jgi:hypothetical protein
MVAAYNYYSDTTTGRPMAPPAWFRHPGPVPPGSFRFDKPEYTLDFDNMSMGGPNSVVGVTLSTHDR